MVVALVLIVSHHASAIVATWTETVSDGPLVATLTTTYFDQSDAFMHADDLQLVVQPAGGGPSAVWRGPAFAPWGPEDAIVERSGAIRLVDVTGDDEAEVLVDMYTGGAHCCAVSYLAWRARSPARYLFRGIRWGNVAPSLTETVIACEPKAAELATPRVPPSTCTSPLKSFDPLKTSPPAVAMSPAHGGE